MSSLKTEKSCVIRNYIVFLFLFYSLFVAINISKVITECESTNVMA